MPAPTKDERYGSTLNDIPRQRFFFSSCLPLSPYSLTHENENPAGRARRQYPQPFHLFCLFADSFRLIPSSLSPDPPRHTYSTIVCILRSFYSTRSPLFSSEDRQLTLTPRQGMPPVSGTTKAPSLLTNKSLPTESCDILATSAAIVLFLTRTSSSQEGAMASLR